MLHRIVVGYDFSESADDALAWAVDLARPHNAQVAVVHVMDAASDDDPAAQAQRARLVHTATELGPEVVSHLLLGDNVARKLVEFAERNDADAIVVATEANAFTGWLLGSVAQEVLRRAHCPVITWRQDDE
jgi:nucleotide-binding universal stress UspA family protein